MAKTFTAQLRGIAERRKKDMLYIATEAIQDVMEAAMTPQLGITKGATSFVEGKIPVAESDLIKSLRSGIGRAGGATSETSYLAVIAGMELGDRLEFEWTAEHALPMETGYTIKLKSGGQKKVPGRHYVGANAKRFSAFVEKRTAEVR